MLVKFVLNAVAFVQRRKILRLYKIPIKSFSVETQYLRPGPECCDRTGMFAKFVLNAIAFVQRRKILRLYNPNKTILNTFHPSAFCFLLSAFSTPNWGK
jgi:hypothetical protein